MQTKKKSLLESLVNTGVEFIGSVFICRWIFGFRYDFSIVMVSIFAVWSIVRNYGIRRIFNWSENADK